MKRCMIVRLSLLIALLVTISTAVHAADSTVFHIPRIEGIIVDGLGNDWAENGFRVEFLTDPSGRAAIISHNVTSYARDMQEFLDAIRNDTDLETTFNEISAEDMSISIKRK